MSHPRLLCTALFCTLLGGSALAADLSPAPVEPVAPTFDWTGFYVGADAGYAWANYDAKDVHAVQNPGFDFYAVKFNRNDNDMKGFYGSLHAGYNYQFANNWVVGGELQGFHRIGGAGPDGNYHPTGDQVIVSGNVDVQVQWYLAAKAKLGYAFDRTLVYGLVGIAAVDTKLPNFDVKAAGINLGFDSDGATHLAGVIGAGVAYALTDNVIVRAEYNFVGANKKTYKIDQRAGGIQVGEIKAKGEGYGSILNVGISYKF